MTWIYGSYGIQTNMVYMAVDSHNHTANIAFTSQAVSDDYKIAMLKQSRQCLHAGDWYTKDRTQALT